MITNIRLVDKDVQVYGLGLSEDNTGYQALRGSTESITTKFNSQFMFFRENLKAAVSNIPFTRC
jgi:hypothetical protein